MSPTPDQRSQRIRCPGVLSLHEAADGWLARVRVPGGRLDAAAPCSSSRRRLRGSSATASSTSRRARTSKLRGLSDEPAAVAELAARLGAAGLLPSAAHDRVRNVLASPLAGRAPGALDGVDHVVGLLDDAILGGRALSELPGRFCFLVDDGTGAGREVAPDVIVFARGGGLFGVALDRLLLEYTGDAAAAVGVAACAAEAFMAARGDAWRLSETPGGAGTIAQALGLALAPVTPRARSRSLREPCSSATGASRSPRWPPSVSSGPPSCARSRVRATTCACRRAAR